ncbi:glutathione S-transferase family protein [Rhizomicrobium electricum]|uniref:Glutathione S-transferase family protein n=1 Tax=Rhizomicrobium electricum TaxID=480070 RepID=A0ABP3PF54_9PROT|nr:glutathione S-transferase family protein [Rhizomicrobium electricum]NIJ48532.1 glutathione S-transferase [Rhizomicrobium electricum]
MLTLYHAPKSRSSSIVWLLEELGQSYQMRVVDIRRADGSGSRDAHNPHPHGKVPALDHDGQHVFETAAIALYLTDLFPEKGLAPKVGDPDRGEYLSWLAYRPGVIEPSLMMRRLNVTHVPGAMGWAPAEEVEAFLNQTLETREYLLGNRFSAADIITGGAIYYLTMFKVMHETPVLKAYTDRITARPAFKRAMES